MKRSRCSEGADHLGSWKKRGTGAQCATSLAVDLISVEDALQRGGTPRPASKLSRSVEMENRSVRIFHFTVEKLFGLFGHTIDFKPRDHHETFIPATFTLAGNQPVVSVNHVILPAHPMKPIRPSMASNSG